MAILETFPSRDNSHTILDTDGTAVAKEDNLQFTGLDVTDDSTNEKTEVKAVGLNADSLNDVCSGEISSAFAQTGLCYSTNEQIVGKWIDGKPLYQITVDCGMGKNATAWTTTVNISNVENVISMEGIALGTETKPVPFVHPGGLDYQIQLDARDFTSSSFGVLINLRSNYTSKHFYVTVRYTKSTD